MQKRSARALFLLLCLFAFSCVLVSGAGRLIGCETPKPDRGRGVADISAALRCAPAPQMQEAGAPGQTQCGGSHRETACPQAGLSPARAVCCDANGNILSAQSYLRTVYRAFALSDGFA